ncbi:CDF family Co(II)/Ni(II) efflux transporter DmeF [Aquabacterium sp.]|uniref:CDF family Co(II)/Ni(II) efflux transporter DmeF n=1 Tax=Aquabacterium sp. TaxID=1872578 RepID=UPI0025C00F61|nr:CDF family Co(II)/Ni(II) efflux transporter DmeF [Aquabacterium sp.]
MSSDHAHPHAHGAHACQADHAHPELSHHHVFHQPSEAAEQGTRLVVWITLAMMVIEITAGWLSHSMALLADGWHMSSHAVAIGLSALAYAASRRYAHDARFTFGTWKVEILGGFASALMLMGVAATMVWGSVDRLLHPEAIAHQEAVVVAVIGLVVNAVCALILMRAGGGHDHHGHGHSHGHGHEHGHAHDHGHHHGQEGEHRDLNLHSAYIHVLADAATSVLAIVALVAGWVWGWDWLDPVTGLVGAALVASWAVGLLKETGLILLDREMDHPVVDEIREVIEQGAEAEAHGTRITDLHVWRVGKLAYSCAMTVVTRDEALSPALVRQRLAIHEEIVHLTVEVHHRHAH